MIASQIVTMPLPHGRDWLYYPDINLLALAPHLDDEGRDRCLEECAAAWRATMRARLASIPKNPNPVPPTQPIPAPALAPVTALRGTPSASVG